MAALARNLLPLRALRRYDGLATILVGVDRFQPMVINGKPILVYHLLPMPPKGLLA